MDVVNPNFFNEFATGVDFNYAAQEAAKEGTAIALNLIGNPTTLIAAIILIAVTIFLLFFLKKIITNSILGGIIWAVSVFVFNAQLPLVPSFVVSIIFGPAGIGVMLILKFFGVF